MDYKFSRGFEKHESHFKDKEKDYDIEERLTPYQYLEELSMCERINDVIPVMNEFQIMWRNSSNFEGSPQGYTDMLVHFLGICTSDDEINKILAFIIFYTYNSTTETNEFFQNEDFISQIIAFITEREIDTILKYALDILYNIGCDIDIYDIVEHFNFYPKILKLLEMSQAANEQILYYTILDIIMMFFDYNHFDLEEIVIPILDQINKFGILFNQNIPKFVSDVASHGHDIILPYILDLFSDQLAAMYTYTWNALENKQKKHFINLFIEFFKSENPNIVVFAIDHNPLYPILESKPNAELSFTYHLLVLITFHYNNKNSLKTDAGPKFIRKVIKNGSLKNQKHGLNAFSFLVSIFQEHSGDVLALLTKGTMLSLVSNVDVEDLISAKTFFLMCNTIIDCAIRSDPNEKLDMPNFNFFNKSIHLSWKHILEFYQSPDFIERCDEVIDALNQNSETDDELIEIIGLLSEKVEEAYEIHNSFVTPLNIDGLYNFGKSEEFDCKYSSAEEFVPEYFYG